MVDRPATPGGVQLIVYPERLGATIPGLLALLDGPFRGVFSGVHLLPFYVPFDGADGGFDPIDHTRVDPRLGTWDDVRALASRFELTADLIVNHVSSRSPQFLDATRLGDASQHASLFLTMQGVFPDGAREEDLLRIYRPRPGLPFTAVPWGEGRRLAWTTFTQDQIDLDLRGDAGWEYLDRVLVTLAEAGVTTVRLDAVGYAIKTAGTSCFLTPDTFDLIDRITARAHGLGMRVLVEVHGHYAQQVALARRVDLVYDFALPPLVLYSLFTGDGDPLRRWLAVRPANAVTVLDTHDGIGVVDIGPAHDETREPGLLDPEQLELLVEGIHERAGQGSRLSTGTGASNVDVYQVNTTYFEALARDDSRYLVARALQFFTPGIPQVYYVGLLAGYNDLVLLAETRVGRDINRRRYLPRDVEEHLVRPVVVALLDLIRFRDAHPAFGGGFSFGGSGEHLELRWRKGRDEARLEVSLGTGRAALTWTDEDGDLRHVPDLFDGARELRLPWRRQA
ncbi:sucrose phosphorylase [Cellulomonas sp. P22]|uniref:sucrose phosphorylase n=1 Tax=Cellulomonas sp. P22 TaxID=3373189 RepID=UPI0037BB895A